MPETLICGQYADYAAKQPQFAAVAPADWPTMYEPVTAEEAVSDCCGHLLTTLGLHIMHPEGGSGDEASPGVPLPPAAVGVRSHVRAVCGRSANVTSAYSSHALQR